MEKNIRKILNVLMILLLALIIRGAFEYAYNLLWRFLEVPTSMGFLIRTLFLGLVILIWALITLRSDSPYQKLPWLFFFLFEPFAGILLFLSMGRSFKHSFRYLKRPLIHDNAYIVNELPPKDPSLDLSHLEPYLEDIFHVAHKTSYHQPFLHDTSVTVLNNGERFYPDLLEEIRHAKQFILMQFYIARSDQRGTEVFEALMKKADEGIQVKIILDAFGSVGGDRVSRKMLRRLKKSPVDLVLNDPVYFPFFNTRMNYRNHRKIVVIDGRIGYTGGMNLGDEYDNSIVYNYHFRDTQVKLEGAAVKSLTAVFFKDYYYNTNHHITDDFYYPHYQTPSNHVVQIIQSGPESDEAFIRNIYLKMIFTAKKSVKIMTPYMAMDQETLTALKAVQAAGIEVSIIVPGTPDKYLVYKVTQFFVSVLVNNGVKVYHYDKGFCHAKILIVDDTIASVGSYNLDNRSAVIDFEVSALFTGDAVKDVVNDFKEDIKVSTLIDPITWNQRPLFKRMVEGLLSLFTPII